MPVIKEQLSCQVYDAAVTSIGAAIASMVEGDTAMSVLVIGGAGYIGSHTVRLLMREGYDVWVYDNLCAGHRAAAPDGRLIEGELADHEHLSRVMKQREVTSVVHFAAFAYVGESVHHPAKYYRNNVVASHSLLTAMLAADVREIVFSSTTATYGVPETIPISEAEQQRPINPYGFTKLVIEQMLRDYQQAYGLRYAALRYFNASGASADGAIGEDHRPESHLIPIILQVALGQREAITIFGNDYPTPDGTCIRDYVHVDDLATAHLAALRKLDPNAPDSVDRLELNLGTGTGHSVQAVLDTSRRVSGHEIPSLMGERRAGDPPELVADPSRARQQLGWEPGYVDLEAIVETAWRWHREHPHGYDDK